MSVALRGRSGHGGVWGEGVRQRHPRVITDGQFQLAIPPQPPPPPPVHPIPRHHQVELLLLDPQIRDWVLFPLIFITVLVQLVRG